MAAPAIAQDDLRTHAARIAFAILRFEEPLAQPWTAHTRPDEPVVGHDAYLFTPSWRPVPRSDVVPFLVSLPSPALLSPTTTRGVIALTLLMELSGDRRRWAEKTLSNFTSAFDEGVDRLGLQSTDRIGLDLGEERQIFSVPAVREWTQRYGVQVGWNLRPAPEGSGARATLCVRRADGRWS